MPALVTAVGASQITCPLTVHYMRLLPTTWMGGSGTKRPGVKCILQGGPGAQERDPFPRGLRVNCGMDTMQGPLATGRGCSRREAFPRGAGAGMRVAAPLRVGGGQRAPVLSVQGRLGEDEDHTLGRWVPGLRHWPRGLGQVLPLVSTLLPSHRPVGGSRKG